MDPPAGLVLRSKLLGVHRKGKGALAESETVLEANGVQYVRIISGAFLVGANGFQVSSKPTINVTSHFSPVSP